MDQTRHHWPATVDTRRPRRCATSRRSCRWNFKANRHRMRQDRAGEAAVAATVNHRKIRDFPATSGLPIAFFHHFWTPPPPPPLNSFPWSVFADSSPFGSYNENKIGRRLDQVFRPPQRLLDQGNGTDEFLVSWPFH